MQTIKTAIVVVLLLFVLYGGYKALNGTDSQLKPELEAQLLGLDNPADMAGPTGPFVSTTSPSASNGFESFNSTPPAGFGSSPFAAPAVASPQPTLPTTPEASNTPGLPMPPLAPLTLPSQPNNGTPTPSPFSNTPSPAAAGSTTPSTLSPLPPMQNPVEIPALPKSVDALELEDPAANAPISSNNPSFSINSSNPSVPASLTSSTSPATNDVKPLQPFDLPPSANDFAADNASGSNSSIKSTSASKSYENAKSLAMEQIDRGNLKEALATLSVFYNASELTTDQRLDMLDLLDALAREVVYSRRHFLDTAYVVAPSDSLDALSKKYKVPGDIIAKINAIDPRTSLPNGALLKVVPGPFRAEIDLTRGELTIFLGDLYASRYPVSFGSDPAPQAGPFQVVDKRKDRSYFGAGIQTIAPNDPRNPYGGFWIDLGGEMCIHGSPLGEAGDGKLGCISLAPRDADDVYSMLDRGSQVTIRK